MDKKNARILIVDDDEQIADILTLRLESEGYSVDACNNVARALELLSQNDYSLVLLDLRLGNENGIDSLPRFRDVDAGVPIFIITAHGDVDSAVRAFSMGANGFIRKPFQEGNLKTQIAQAIESYHMKLEIQKIKQADNLAASTSDPQKDVEKFILARDPIMLRFIEQVRIASATSSNVVIFGQSGTGKELVAKALHQLGPRAKGPFVAINCGALPETLLESELFGHVKGSFTDARENKVGLVVRANGGTLFLDEIGDAPLSIQIKLLRVLQEREVLPVGGTSPVKVDVRVVVATHRDLKALVAENKFREDLFYRLHVLPLNVPPLRERKQDIVYLANIFANRFAAELGKKVDGFTASAMVALHNYPWPGNVRELQNRVEHAVVMGRGPVVTSTDLFPEGLAVSSAESAVLPESLAPEPQPRIQAQAQSVPVSLPVIEDPIVASALAESDMTVEELSLEGTENLLQSGDGAGLDAGALGIATYREAKEEFERQYIQTLLRVSQGNIAKAARMAGKYRTEVYGLMKKYSVDPRQFKRADSYSSSRSPRGFASSGPSSRSES